MIIADNLIISSFDHIYCDDLSSEDLSLNQREIPARWLQSSISLNVHLEEGAFLFSCNGEYIVHCIVLYWPSQICCFSFYQTRVFFSKWRKARILAVISPATCKASSSHRSFLVSQKIPTGNLEAHKSRRRFTERQFNITQVSIQEGTWKAKKWEVWNENYFHIFHI